MELINCLNCGRLILDKPSHLCHDCLMIQQEDFKKVKAYLVKHPRATLMEVHRGTGVSLKIIRELTSDHPIQNNPHIK